MTAQSPDFEFVTLVCRWSGSVGLSPGQAKEWRVNIERRAVAGFQKWAAGEWPGVEIEEAT